MSTPSLQILLLLALLAPACRRYDDAPPPAPPGYPPPGQWMPPPAPPAPSPPPPAFPAPWWQPPPGGFPFPLPGWSPPPSPFPDPAQRCVDTVNQYRQSLRLPPLARWFPAEPCAASQARDGAATGQAHGSFGRCGEMGQNVCPSWAGPPDRIIGPCMQTMWNEGPGGDFARHGHYLNMTSNRFTRIACGYFTTPAGSTWAVQDFQ